MNLSGQPVTRLTIANVELSNGTKFSIVHDLAESAWTRLFNKWLRLAKRPTEASLITFVKNRLPYCICVTKADYESITIGKSVPATEAEWKAENFGRNE